MATPPIRILTKGNNMTDLITVEVYKHGYSEDIPTRPHELMEFLQSKIDVIPAEFMESARIEIGLDYEFGETHLGVKITYERPKTDEELDKEDRLDSEYKARLGAKERRTLAELLAKYPDHGGA